MDYDRFLVAREWDTPEGYTDLARFNAALTAQATGHSSLTWEPPSKTTHGGGQTGELLDGNEGPITKLESMLSC